MILPKHPDLMSDRELEEWIISQVNLKTPESIFLDYKQTIATDSRSDKREIAKDVSSFANERGGIVLYGIPEDQRTGEPVPVDINLVGIAPIPGLPEVIENILVSTLTPRLPELRVREIPLTVLPGKVVYLVWHPESWEAPHMIHAYDEHRYYRRGNFRAVQMEEGEIERLYHRRQVRRMLASQFLEETDFGGSLFPSDQGLLVQFVVCPAFPFENRIDFSTGAMREYLRTQEWVWQPFVGGIRQSRLHGWSPADQWQTEWRLFHNGAASFYGPLQKFNQTERKELDGLIFLVFLVRFFDQVGSFYDQFGIVGDVLIDIAVFNANEM